MKAGLPLVPVDIDATPLANDVLLSFNSLGPSDEYMCQ